MVIQSILKDIKTERGESLYELSLQSAVILIFLRQFNCVFCREAIKDISSKLDELKANKIRPVFVHLATPEKAKPFFESYNLRDVDQISNPSSTLYQEFGLTKGTFRQLFGLKVMIRGFEVASQGIYPKIATIGDGFQMPGVFIIENGEIKESYIHKTVADRPDYDSIMSCCIG